MTKARENSDYTGLAADLAGLQTNITAGDTAARAGRKNLILNGSMQVSQRGTSSAGLGASNGYFTLDRWAIQQGNSAGRFTMTQDSDGPAGFANCLKLDCTTADTSIAAGETLILQQMIEGQDLQQLKKGTSSAEQVTISFWVKGNASATAVAEIYDLDNDVHINQLFSITTDWVRVELTYDGDTAARVFNDDNGASLQFNIWLHSGSTFSSGSIQSSWGSNNGGRAAGISSFYDSTARTFSITGVQLEVGSGTDFEHRSYGEELALCMRYYEIMGGTAAADYDFMFIGAVWTTTQARFGLQWKVPKRTSPTVTESGTWYARNASGQSGSVTSKSLEQPTPFGLSPFVTVSGGGLTAGNATQIWASDGKIIADSEL